VGYRISFINEGEEPADNIVLNNPVPENTHYVADSARGANTDIDYSVDGGKRFGQPSQLFIEKNGKKSTSQSHRLHPRPLDSESAVKSGRIRFGPIRGSSEVNI